jgi:hypothetical protein
MHGSGIEREGEICATNLATNVRASSQFLFRIFLLPPTELAWSHVIKLL